jgi:hypothetical protein
VTELQIYETKVQIGLNVTNPTFFAQIVDQMAHDMGAKGKEIYFFSKVLQYL